MQIGDLIWHFTTTVRKFIRETAPEFFQTRRRIVLLGIGGAVLVLILAFVAVLMVQGHIRTVKSRAAAKELADSFKPLAISPEDFFLPEEPDALPEFIPERLPRDTWTVDDARPYWTDPLEGNTRLWRDRFKAEIDTLMEGVP
ncbi:hypothetical protein LQZ19_00270 [Treponema primitia]|uniref:hypothetical protein n=1 Tax=Treponema primitia TaxID=88058 RepID=UPI0039813947